MFRDPQKAGGETLALPLALLPVGVLSFHVYGHDIISLDMIGASVYLPAHLARADQMTQLPRRAGRPKLSPLKRRDRRFRIYLTEDEHDLLLRRARMAGVPTHVLARDLALYSRVAVPTVPRANFALVGQLGRIGNALNQAVRKVNSGQLAPELSLILQEILALLKDVRHILVTPQ